MAASAETFSFTPDTLQNSIQVADGPSQRRRYHRNWCCFANWNRTGPVLDWDDRRAKWNFELSHVTPEMLPHTFGGQLTDFDPKAYVRPRKTLKVMCRELQTAFSACSMATQHSELDIESVAKERVGTVFGSEMLYGEPDEIYSTVARSSPEGRFQPDLWGESAMKEIFPLWMLKYLPNMAACHYGIALGALGPNNTIVMGDTSGLSALIESISVIQRDAADVMVVCSTGTRVSLPRLLYLGISSMAPDEIRWRQAVDRLPSIAMAW
ncbi:MAG: beta-ketoacyl synthase N-terminal-like domain-containing protein [Pirellulaceae bacterium]